MHLDCSKLLAGIMICTASSTALAQAPSLPLPEKTDPVLLEIMKGFPPPADKVVTLGSVLKYPNARWAFHHMRELGPTAAVWRGSQPGRAFATSPKNLDGVTFRSGEAELSIAEWQKRTYTDGLIVLHNGKVVYERLYSGMQAHQPHSLWSVTKSFTGLLTTLLISEGKIDPNAKITHYIPELSESGWSEATVQQALDMTTGLKYREVFSDPTSELFPYLFASGFVVAPPNYGGARAMVEFLKTVKKQDEHGEGFRYKSVDTEILGWVIQRVTGRTFAELISERIWSKIGAEEDGYVWVDPKGTQITSIGLSATLRDLARLGETLRLNGKLDGKQIFPKQVVAEIRKGADREKFKASGQTVRFGYSYHNQFWIAHNRSMAFEMKGLNGQHVHINPVDGVVIVKLSSHPIGDTAFTHVIDTRAFEAIAGAVKD